MRCEFAKDDNGTIWFMYADKIFRRDTPGLSKSNNKVKLIKYIN